MKKITKQEKVDTIYDDLIKELEKLIIKKAHKKEIIFDYDLILKGLIRNHIYSPGLTPLGHKQAKQWLKKITKEII